jgi:hypothetical protein
MSTASKGKRRASKKKVQTQVNRRQLAEQCLLLLLISARFVRELVTILVGVRDLFGGD